MRNLFYRSVAAVCLAAAPVSQAAAMTVQPVVLDLQTAGRGMSQVITVENTFSTPLPVELQIQQLELTEDGVKLTGVDPGDLLVFPPQALIQPGQTQSFRVQYVGDPDLQESKHYYITVAQLPVKLPEGQSAIQILYNFQVLVSIGPQGGKPAIAVVDSAVSDDAGHHNPLITVRNDSANYGYLSQGKLRVVARDAAGNEVARETLNGPEIQQRMGFGLIGGHQTRKVRLPVELPTAAGTVEVTFSPGD
ncbi:fimbria/pilus periplasmic chaperone [Tsuneonella rigui]|uniref:fimbria/pilus periplasmic chaperone n=1 Tax=Tsuneonella rigui TaxID=1708790 RepID=UPI000F7EA201|nr:fimbria/pilus periplasmic chaperone [Tsuneonella rigui]